MSILQLKKKITLAIKYIFILYLSTFSQNLFGQFCNNGTSSETISITENTQATSSYSSGRRVFEFDATAGNTYEFATCNTSSGDTKLRLYSSATGGTELGVSDNDCGANGKQSEIIWLCSTTGTYSILLTKKNCKNLNFSAAVSYFMTVPNPCSEITLNVNAGNELSLCNGSNAALNAAASATYSDGVYNHCASNGNTQYLTSITNFSFNGETTINNSSTKTQSYTDYSGTIIGEAIAGSSYSSGLSMRINSDGDWTILSTVWIDWNRNDIFEDAEAYQLGSTTNSADGITSLSPLAITVPANTTPGYVKVRATCKWDGDGNQTACETGYDGEVEDYAILITSPLSYSWSPSTGINNTSLLNPNCSATANTTYGLTVSTNNGCNATENVNVIVETTPSITSSSNITGTETCGEISISLETNAIDGTGSWSHSNGLGLFSSSTDANTTFTTNTFNSSQNLIWTSNTGACSGSTAEVSAQFNQPNTSNLTDLQASTSWLWGGLNNSEFNEASNWYKWDGFKWLRESSSIPGTSDKIYVLSNNESGLCVSPSSNLTISSDVASLFISEESSINLNGDISISGDIVNNGSLISTAGTLSINGVSNQQLSGSGTNSLYNIVLDKNTGDFILNAPLGIINNLNLNSGNIRNSDNILTIGTSSTEQGSITHNEGRITGKLRRYFGGGNLDVLFPVGNNAFTRDITVNIQDNPGVNQYLTIEYKEGYAQGLSGNLDNGLPLSTLDGQQIDNVSGDGYWEISPTNNDYSSTINSKEYTVSIHANSISEVTDYSKTRIIKSSGSNTPSENHAIWSTTSHLSAIGNNNDYLLTAQSSGFSFFTIGGSGSNALPVELISFSGTCNQGQNELVWKTASEHNSSHFFIDWSRNGYDWESISQIPAAGFSNTNQTYGINHTPTPGGTSYYRLSQFDNDGENRVYSEGIIELSCEFENEQKFQVYPNPNNGNFTIKISDEKNIQKQGLMSVFSTRGALVYQTEIFLESGINIFSVNENLSNGIYIIKLDIIGTNFLPTRFVVR